MKIDVETLSRGDRQVRMNIRNAYLPLTRAQLVKALDNHKDEFSKRCIRELIHEDDRERLKPSVSIKDNPTHACVTASEEWGAGVFSWHTNEADARHNAEITGGRVETIEEHKASMK